MPLPSPPHSVFSSPLDLESISNGPHSLSITDAPKLEQFPHITSPEVNGSSSVHSPFFYTDPVKTWKTKMSTSIRLFRGIQDNLKTGANTSKISSELTLKTINLRNLLAILRPSRFPSTRRTKYFFATTSKGKQQNGIQTQPPLSEKIGIPQGLFPRALQVGFTRFTDQALGEKG